MSKEKLESCPFCGGKAKVWKTVIKKTRFVVYYVGCDSKKCKVNSYVDLQNSELPIFKDEGLVLNSSVHKALREQAISIWNKRSK